MVSFECQYCRETVNKPKVKKHLESCPAQGFSCIDCNTTFDSKAVHNHTSCITEAQKEKRAPTKKSPAPRKRISCSLSITPQHVRDAQRILLSEKPTKTPNLKMLTRHALHFAFLEELKELSKSSESIVAGVAKDANVGCIAK